MKKYLFVFLVYILILPCLSCAHTQDKKTIRVIENTLVQKGLDQADVHRMLTKHHVKINEDIIIKNLFYSAPVPDKKAPEYMEIDEKNIERGRIFIKKHKDYLMELENRFKTGPEIITAILIVESKLGTYKERYNAFDAYLSLAACSDPDFRQYIRRHYSAEHPYLKKNASMDRMARKGNWALDELYALIVLTQAIGRDPLNTPGSFAGALGPAQFIPTSFMNYGIDGNNDNKKDPFDMQDAMASIANYLHCAGWTQDTDITEKRKAVWAYNHSRVYVNTILMLCDRCTAP